MHEIPVGADLSCAPQIYRPTPTLLCILAILFIVIIGPMLRTGHQLVHSRGDGLSSPWGSCGRPGAGSGTSFVVALALFATIIVF